MAGENLHKGHRERLKQRALEEGLDAFTEHQALELLLFFAMPYKDTNELAHRLLASFGSFDSVLDADYHELLRVEGVGPNTATLFSLMPEFYRRYMRAKLRERPLLIERRQAGAFICSLFIGQHYESFYLICLDAHQRLLKAALLSTGTIDHVGVYPRVAVETALRYHAHSVLLAHNHPSGEPQPSHLDIQLTEGIRQAMELIGIRVRDHFIACGDHYISLSELGLMPKRK